MNGYGVTRKELIDWVVKNPKVVTKFVDTLLVHYELSVAMEKLVNKAQTNKKN